MRGLAVFICIFLCMTATMMGTAESLPAEDIALSTFVNDWANCLPNVSNTDINIRRTLINKNHSKPEMRGLAVFMCIFLCMTATMMSTAESQPVKDVALIAPDNVEGSPAKGEKRLCTSWVCFYL
ncbi:hypothetical protein ACJMK2_036437 [Sinanodonta woodiana]|uniref:Uncharacterized protein n=1 Tax=Sinanodonta woodiana TaxID=1069815 RepID=A0ABD3WID8_SINWO